MKITVSDNELFVSVEIDEVAYGLKVSREVAAIQRANKVAFVRGQRIVELTVYLDVPKRQRLVGDLGVGFALMFDAVEIW